MSGFAEIPQRPPSASVSSEVVAVHCVLGCVGGGGVMMAKFVVWDSALSELNEGSMQPTFPPLRCA